MQNDPSVEETREIRNRLAAKFKYDLEALGAYYQAKQMTGRRVVVKRQPKLIKTRLQPGISRMSAPSVKNSRSVKSIRRQQMAAAAPL